MTGWSRFIDLRSWPKRIHCGRCLDASLDRVHAGPMRRALVVAFAVAIAGLVVPPSFQATGDAAVAKTGDGCPGKLGALRLSSSSLDDENPNKRELSCLYVSKDYAKNVVVRVSWLTKAASPAWLSDLEPTYCLRADEDSVGPGQHGDKTRWGYVFPHPGERYILGAYLATENGPGVGRIKDLARKLVSRHADLAPACPAAADPGPVTDDSPSSAADPPDADGDEATADSDAAVADPGTTVTTIVLS